jgi:hypothetical protein
MNPWGTTRLAVAGESSHINDSCRTRQEPSTFLDGSASFGWVPILQISDNDLPPAKRRLP